MGQKKLRELDEIAERSRESRRRLVELTERAWEARRRMNDAYARQRAIQHPLAMTRLDDLEARQ